MTCAAGKANFRLLDNNVGWDQDPAATVNLTGFDQPTGVCLAALDPGALDPNQIFPYVSPPLLTRGCGACEWYLLTAAPPESLLLHRDACHAQWQPIPFDGCAKYKFVKAVAVATWRKCIAISDQGANCVYLWSRRGARLLAQIPVVSPGPLSFCSNGDLLVTRSNSTEIARYAFGGNPHATLRASLPQPPAPAGSALGSPQPTLYAIAVDKSENVWVVFRLADSFTLWRALKGDVTFVQQTSTSALQTAFPQSALAIAARDGFCFNEDTAHGLGVLTCFSWYGRPLKQCDLTPYSSPQRQTQGQMITLELDSQVARCEWHRVRLDADIPLGTALIASVATTEIPHAPAQGDASRDAGWTTFPAGAPHFKDWTSGPTASVDFLVDQPPGRYLFFRLRLLGDGTHTPTVRRVRLDFPRLTSLDRLPEVYRETPKAEDFSKRFLALFDSSISDLDPLIQRYPALLFSIGVPDQLLPWLGSFFDIAFDPTWGAGTRRAILNIVPQLYRNRGTAAALQAAVKVVFGIVPAITEFSSTGPWGSIASRQQLDAERCDTGAPSLQTQRNVRLSSTRLFGKNAMRLRLGHSALGSAPIRSFGDPSQDPFSSGAFRLQIQVPPFGDMSPEQLQRLTNLINAQKPAHTVASIRVGGTGFLLGTWSAVGVDTAFVPLAPPILGASGNIRLNRMSILGGEASAFEGISGLGVNSIVGMQTIAG
jgi:phage tail-like protein